jgi:hypothetical protein
MNRATRAARRGRGSLGLAAGIAASFVLLAAPLAAKDYAAFAARSGVELAREAAVAWAPDAVLVYVENDERVDGQGGAVRWGYLFHSPSLEQSRAYSVRDGKIVTAENLEMRFEAPALADGWIDSGAALAAVEKEAGKTLAKTPGVRLSTMLLMRGPFQDGDPDRTAWTLIYTVPEQPALFVLVDAVDGKVRRSWRG